MATSLKLEAGEQIDRERIIASLLREFEENYNIFIEHLNLKPFLKEYNERLVSAGQQIRILADQEGKVRFAHGIDETGALLVSDKDGKIERIISGEVSVRGLYGYV